MHVLQQQHIALNTDIIITELEDYFQAALVSSLVSCDLFGL